MDPVYIFTSFNTHPRYAICFYQTKPHRQETLQRLLKILHRYGLPTETGYALDKLYEAELVDKKISGGKMHLIVPEKIGQVRVETIPVEMLRDWMRDGGIR